VGGRLAAVLVLRKALRTSARPSQEADRWARCLHLRSVRCGLHGHSREGTDTQSVAARASRSWSEVMGFGVGAGHPCRR